MTLSLCILGVVLIGPLVWIVLVSFGLERFVFHLPPVAPPAIQLAGYQRLVGLPEWRGAAIVSVVVAIGATALALAVATFAAYPLARLRMSVTRPLLLLLLGLQLIPPIALAIPLVYVFIRLDIRDTVIGLVLVNAAFWSPILVWLARAAFLAVPRNLDWAARIDGATRVGTILRVVLPAAAPGIAAAAVVVFVGIWNDFVFATVIGGRDTYTLPRYLAQTQYPIPLYFAANIVLTVVPCVILVTVLRRRIFGIF